LPSGGSYKDRDRVRELDRLIARLAREGPGLGLVEACLERAELLVAAQAFPEAFEALDEVLAVSAGEEDLVFVPLRARAHMVRARLEQDCGAGGGGALVELEQALAAVAAHGSPDDEVRRLSVDLHVFHARLLLTEELPGAEEELRGAIGVARRLSCEGCHLVVLGARRELAVALAHRDVDLALEELAAAEAEATEEGPLPEVDEHLLRSTRAEVLANGGRFDEALGLLQPTSEDAPEWILAQRAATFDLAGRSQEALEAGRLLIERRSADHDPRSARSATAVAEVLVAQAGRSLDPEQRFALAGQARRVLEEASTGLPLEGRRLLAQTLELLAGCLDDPEEVHEALSARASCLEQLVRELGAAPDGAEVIRAWLQLGDAAMELDRVSEARRTYGCAVRALRERPGGDPLVAHLLPLALNALGHAQAHLGHWGAAVRSLDEAARSLVHHRSPAALAPYSEVLLFRALAYVSVGDPAGAVERLRQDIGRFLGGVGGEEAAHLLETVVELSVLQAEVLVDHLDHVDEALECYDQAIQLRELGGAPPGAIAALLGAKGVILNEDGRPAEALPFLERSLGIYQNGVSNTSTGSGDLALARVNLAACLSASGEPRRALEQITQAGGALERDLDDDDEVDEAEALRREAIRAHMFLQRGEALVGVGHPLLAADEFTRSIDLCEGLLEEDGEAHYEAKLRLPLALLRRARCWLDSGRDHGPEAAADLKRAYRLYVELVQDEARPMHRRKLREVRELQRRAEADASPQA
jgi:tetratricopeptide (TPR) repeat protein